MNNTIHSLTIYDVIRPSARWMEAPLLLAFNLLLVACSYLSFNLPFSPVPVTGQTFGVLLVAMALGRVRGSSVVLAYLAEGAAGLPVFAGGAAGVGVLAGPTGGYLIGFLAAAYVAGWLADLGWDKGYVKSVVAMLAGNVVIFACGLAQLSMYVPAGSVLALGLYPFIAGGIVKIALAAVILPSVWKLVDRRRN
ncbi:MAG: biotin transporter BioY [Candidatus Zixiibacteriota bacterium]